MQQDDTTIAGAIEVAVDLAAVRCRHPDDSGAGSVRLVVSCAGSLGAHASAIAIVKVEAADRRMLVGVVTASPQFQIRTRGVG